ncbi:MAG TPA: exonuclease [Marinobacter sp.]|nr:exonuclease [Marinobacter sp.]
MIIHECAQQSEEWFAARLGKVTASCFSDATSAGRGSSPSKTRKDYMLKLVAERMTGLPSESYSNKAMERGTETEQEAREYYEALNGCEVRQVGFIERDEDTGASPDGLVGDDGMLEIKCPFPTTHIRYILADKMPADYVKQIQGNLWVAEREWIDFMSYNRRVRQRPFFCKRVYRDESFIKEQHIKIVMFVDEMKAILEKLTASPF